MTTNPTMCRTANTFAGVAVDAVRALPPRPRELGPSAVSTRWYRSTTGRTDEEFGGSPNNGFSNRFEKSYASLCFTLLLSYALLLSSSSSCLLFMALSLTLRLRCPPACRYGDARVAVCAPAPPLRAAHVRAVLPLPLAHLPFLPASTPSAPLQHTTPDSYSQHNPLAPMRALPAAACRCCCPRVAGCALLRLRVPPTCLPCVCLCRWCPGSASECCPPACRVAFAVGARASPA